MNPRQLTLKIAASPGALVQAVIVMLLLTVGCNGGADTEAIERHKKLAGELRDTKLYSAAIEEYQKLLAIPGLESKQRANVNYLVAKIYFEDLADYSQAAAYYVRARALDREGSFVNEASKNLVACLEKTGRMVDAKRQLDAATSLDTTAQQPGDVKVAEVGGQSIWLSEVEKQIQLLPAEVQSQFTNRQSKIDFAHQYVAAELIYRAAIREGYDDDPEIRQEQRLLGRKLLIDKYVVDKIMPQVAVDSMDVRNYYQANKDARYNSAPFDSVRAEVFMDYSNEKAGSAVAAYIDKLAAVEKVEFFDQNIQ